MGIVDKVSIVLYKYVARYCFVSMWETNCFKVIFFMLVLSDIRLRITFPDVRCFLVLEFHEFFIYLWNTNLTFSHPPYNRSTKVAAKSSLVTICLLYLVNDNCHPIDCYDVFCISLKCVGCVSEFSFLHKFSMWYSSFVLSKENNGTTLEQNIDFWYDSKLKVNNATF